MNKIRKAVIPCGGCGTRFLPITKAVAKEMLPIIDRPCLDYIVDELVASGIEEILFIVSPDKPEIERFYTENKRLTARLTDVCKGEIIDALHKLEGKAKFSYAMQFEARGSGHAMLLAEDFCADEPFAIALGDDLMCAKTPVTKQLMDTFSKYGQTVHGVQRRTIPEIYRYGIIKFTEALGEDAFRMNGIKEKPKTPEELTSDLAGLGRYIVTPDIFDFIRATPWADNGELQFTDALNLQAQQVGAVAQVFEGRRYDIGDKLGSLEAIVELALARKDLGVDFKNYLKKLRLDD